jgi:hypothetical protein
MIPCWRAQTTSSLVPLEHVRGVAAYDLLLVFSRQDGKLLGQSGLGIESDRPRMREIGSPENLSGPT